MKTLQAASGAVRRLTAAAPAVIPRRSVSMKQPYDTAKAAGIYPSQPGYERIRQLQIEWSKDPENMVWQKRGAADSVPMYVTYAIMFAGLAYGFSILWKMAWPKKNQEE